MDGIVETRVGVDNCDIPEGPPPEYLPVYTAFRDFYDKISHDLKIFMDYLRIDHPILKSLALALVEGEGPRHVAARAIRLWDERDLPF